MKNHISEIIDISRIKNLFERFTNATDTGTAVLDLEGKVLVATGWQDICTKFHRANPESCKNCIQSDTVLSNSLSKGEKFNLYQCLNGMTDVAVPITIGDDHVGNLFIGQFLMQKPDPDFFRKQAAKYGFDEEKYMEALSKVSIISEDEVLKKIDFLSELALLIGEMGLARLELMEMTGSMEKTIKERTSDLKDAQLAALNMMQDADEARKETEVVNKNLENTMQNLERSNKELEQFAYIASHDLQEPLRMVSSYTQLLERRYKDKLDQDAVDFIGYAVDGATRMQRLINDLLDFSRVTTKGKPLTEIDLSTILGYAIANLYSKIQETSAIITNDGLPLCMGDESQLIRVFQNLIDNAIKFSNDHSPRIHISSVIENDIVTISIKDNGIGIEPQYQDRVFTIFQRLHGKTEYPGTGIGLAICKRTIERHGGIIWYESEFGKGTTFKFTLNTK